MADRCLSDDDTAKYIAWADSEYRDHPLVAVLALTWSSDPASLAILKTKAAGPESDVSGAAACAVLVRTNRTKCSSEMVSALTDRLVKSTNRYERMFVANRLFVDFPASALRPIVDAARVEPDRGVQCDMLYYVAALANRVTAREVLTWAGNLAFAQVPEGLSLVMGCLTPGRQPGGFNNSTFGLARALRAKAAARR